MSDRHRFTRRHDSAPSASAPAGGLSSRLLALTALCSCMFGGLSGCPSGSSTQDAKPAHEGTALSAQRVPSCEQGDLAAVARTLEGNRAGWTSGRGIVPDFSGYVAAALWKSCDLPLGARVLLAHAVTLPKPKWVVDGTPKPANAEDPAEQAMPGFGEARAAGEDGRAALAAFQQTACATRDAVSSQIATLPASQRPGAVFDGCKLDDTLLSRDAFVAADLTLDGVGFVALHAWLLEANVEPEVATTLLRTLAAERPARLTAATEFAPPPALRLVGVDGGLPPREGVVVYVGPDAIRVGDMRIGDLPPDGSIAALLQSGALASLEDTLGSNMPPGGGVVLLAIDRSLSWPAIAGVVASSARAGAADIEALVLGPKLSTALRRVPLAQAGAEAPFTIQLEIGSLGAAVTCGETSVKVAFNGVAEALTSCAGTEAGGGPVEVTVSGAPRVRDVLDALDGLGERERALRGTTPRASAP